MIAIMEKPSNTLTIMMTMNSENMSTPTDRAALAAMIRELADRVVPNSLAVAQLLTRALAVAEALDANPPALSASVEMKRDTQRLDWLESWRGNIFTPSDKREHSWAMYSDSGVRTSATSLRELVDRACEE